MCNLQAKTKLFNTPVTNLVWLFIFQLGHYAIMAIGSYRVLLWSLAARHANVLLSLLLGMLNIGIWCALGTQADRERGGQVGGRQITRNLTLSEDFFYQALSFCYGSCLENKKPKSGGVTCQNSLKFRSLVSRFVSRIGESKSLTCDFQLKTRLRKLRKL